MLFDYEAHNLVDRAREMYSAGLTKKMFRELRSAVKAEMPGLYDIATRLWKYFVNKESELSADSDDDNKNFFRVRETIRKSSAAFLRN